MTCYLVGAKPLSETIDTLLQINGMGGVSSVIFPILFVADTIVFLGGYD